MIKTRFIIALCIASFTFCTGILAICVTALAQCSTNEECDDGLYCNGAEFCLDLVCYDGIPPCTEAAPVCDEANDRCVECLEDSHCNDLVFCNGEETCDTGNATCLAGADPCPGQRCDEELLCISCDADDDCDGVCNPAGFAPDCSGSDNCSLIPNGSLLGSCVSTKSDITLSYWTGSPLHHIICTSDADCASVDGTCQLEQGDCNGNGVGDACECYADCNRDPTVNLTDLVIMKQEFFRNDCATNPCQADANGDNQVNLSDLVIIKIQYFRTDCPVIPE